MRKLKRSIARHNMLRIGFTNLNKKNEKDPEHKSVFARHWREYV